MQINNRKTLLGCIFVLLIAWQSGLKAQTVNGEVWGAYINTIQLNNKWKIWNDYHYVSNGFSIIRPGLVYQTNNNYHIGAGYAYVRASTVNTNSLKRQENRIWGQVIKRFQLQSKFQYIIRFRYDARFRLSINEQGELIDNQYTFNNRFRLMQDLRYRVSPIHSKSYWHFDFINETLLNAGRQIDNGIDQVRSYLMIGYTKPSFTLLAGYHQRFIPGKTKSWTLNHGLTIWLIHNIDLRQ